MDAGNRNSIIASLHWKGLQKRTFRAQLSAAPLKPVDTGLNALGATNIPRSIERGPVEARSFERNSSALHNHSALN